MITFRRMGLLERLLLRIPSRRRAYEASMLATITALVRDPTLPCVIEGVVVPHGFGPGA